MADPVTSILEADERIRSHITRTPLMYSEAISQFAGAHIYFKLENLQVTGSFKVRGALNKVMKLKSEKPDATILTASTGNHALGIAHALQLTKQRGKIYLTLGVSQSKVELIKSLGIPTEFYGTTGKEIEEYVRSLSDTDHQIYISPYNDLDVIAGQGTIALEIYRQQPLLDAIFIAVGGGGLVTGIAAYLKSVNPNISIVGCLPEKAAAMLECIKAGKIIEVKEAETLSESTAGGVEEGSITFDLCRQLVDEFVTVSEIEILHALRLVYKHHQMIIEGAAGVPLAALLKSGSRWEGKNVAIVICGGNAEDIVVQRIINPPQGDFEP